MQSLFVVGLCVVAILVAVAEVSGRSCAPCGLGDGNDYCGCNPDEYMIHPVPVKPTGIRNMKPISDCCSCSNVKVRPVALPNPKYVWTEKKSEKCDNSPLIPAPDHMHDFGEEEEYEADYLLDSTVMDARTPCGSRPLYPVDAVSLGLVHHMHQSAALNVPEEKLQYGFWKLPKDIPVHKITADIPEEKLYTVERQIVELKAPKQIVKYGSNSKEEIVVEDRHPHPITYLTYHDLGFVPESVSDSKFITSCRQNRRPSEKCRDYEERYIIKERADNTEEDDYICKVNKNADCTMKKLKSSCDC